MLRRTLIAAALLTALVLPATASAKRVLYAAGGSTQNVAALDVAAAGLTPLASSPTANGGLEPDSLVLPPNGTRLYAANAVTDNVSGFNVAADGALTLLSSSPFTAGNNPQAMSATSDGRFVYAVNNSGVAGSISGFAIGSDGALTAVPGSPFGTFAGGRGIASTPDARFVYSTDFSVDRIFGFSIGADGALTALPGPPFATGDIPSDLVVSPDGRFLYTALSGDDVINGFTIASDGALTPIPGATIAIGPNSPALAITPDGKHLYNADFVQSANFRGFDVAADGSLTPIPGSPFTLVGVPAMTISPDSSRIFAATNNANDDAVSVFAIAANGVPTAITGSPFPAGVTGVAGEVSVAISPNQGPTAAFTATPAPPGQQTAFNGAGSTDSDGTVASYAWDFGDGQTATTTAPTADHIYAAPGTYTAKLTVTDNEGCSTALVYTGQTASCNGAAKATVQQQVTITDPPPTTKLSGKKTQKLDDAVEVGVSCDEACTATGSGQLVVTTPGGKSALKTKKFKLKKATKQLQANKKGTLKLKLSRKAQKAAAKALADDGKVVAKLTVKTTDNGGNTTTVRRQVKLKL